MTEISRRLRAARELAGLSIDDVAARTRIRPAALQAIERGDFSRLPGEFYTRAFLRTYAREVRLSPDEIVHEYDAARTVTQAQPANAVATTAGRESAGASPAISRRERAPAYPHLPTWSIPEWLTGQSARTAAALATAVGVLLMLTVFKSRPAGDRPPEAGAVATSGVVEAAPAPADATPRPAAPTDRLTIEIQPAGPIWVTAAADGKRVLYRLLAPGERVTLEARDDLSFRIGNAAAFAFTINGVPGKPLGGPDEVREFRITRDNYRTFGQ